MKCFCNLLGLFLLLFLFGCADSHTTGTEKDIDVKSQITITQHSGNKGSVNIYPGVDVKALAGDTKQDTANTAETPTKVDLNLDDVNNPTTTLTKVLERKADTKILKKADEESPEPVTGSVTFNDLGPENGRMFRWMELTGENYHGPISFTFGDYTMVVNDPAHDYNTQSPRDPAEGAWFCGKELEACKQVNCVASVFSPKEYTGTTVVVSWMK